MEKEEEEGEKVSPDRWRWEERDRGKTGRERTGGGNEKIEQIGGGNAKVEERVDRIAHVND